MIGILVSNFFPSFYLLCIITLILIAVTYLTILKIQNEREKKMENEEKEKFLEGHKKNPDHHGITESSAHQDAIEPVSLFQILWHKKTEILLIIFSFGLLIFGNVSKGSDKHPTPIFTRCSPISFIIFFFCMIIPIFIALRKKEKV